LPQDFLIDTLYSPWFCCSYTDIQKFERSAATTQGTDIPGCTPETFIQYVADNVDHNVRSLDGQGTFHGMGIIATVTPGTSGSSIPITRKTVTADDIAAAGRIDIHVYHNQCTGISSLKYNKLENRQAQDATSKVDLLWKISHLLRSPRPAWSGMMQQVHTGPYPGQSSVKFLPMIDMNPSDMTCIQSTLDFVCSHASATTLHQS
jgi:hypothetical protein